MPDDARIQERREGAVAILSLQHARENRLTQGMLRDLAAAIVALEKDEAARAVVVTGAGGRCFSSGLDQDEWSVLTPRDAQIALERGFDVLWALEHLTKPTIAAVEGPCRSVGAELALACDLRFASASAVFAFPEVDEAWMPSHGGTARLPRMVGRARALELLLSGRDVTAKEAASLGFVERVVPRGKALAASVEVARGLAKKPRTAVRALKRALTEGEEKPYRNRFLLESQHSVQLLWTEAYREAREKERRKGA